MKNKLVAHRGDMTSYPENSLIAVQAAVDLGLLYIEIDIQLSKDTVPIVMHDENLLRTVGEDRNVRDLTEADINSYVLSDPNSTHYDLNDLKIPTLGDIINLLNHSPDRTLFVELKRQSIEYFEIDLVVEAVLKELKKAQFKVVLISFVAEVIFYLKNLNAFPVGWVVKEFDSSHQRLAQDMQPDYLFCNVTKIGTPENLWEGSWQWVLYDIVDPNYAAELLEHGVSFIETGDIIKLTQAQEFQ